MTFAELVQKVRDYTEVDSTVLSDSIVGSMIRDAELRIFREVDADYTREYATANLNIGSPYLDLPNASGTSGTQTTRRSIIVRSFLVYDDNQTPTAKDFLDKRDSTFIFEYNSTSATGVPKYYAIYDENSFILAPTPNSNFTVELGYSYKPTSITTASSGTSWLGTNAHDCLLYASLVEAYTFMKGEPDIIQNYENRFLQAIDRLKVLGEGRNTKDEDRTGPPRKVVN